MTVNASDRAEHLNVSARRSTVKVQGLPTVVDITGSELTDLLQVNALGGNDVVKVKAVGPQPDRRRSRPRAGQR